ncbi:MAG: hypothetical protein JSS02_06235 [Planctomycetes bacterium]|nr:hypothetical protein [Planctomycetota bacterium]
MQVPKTVRVIVAVLSLMTPLVCLPVFAELSPLPPLTGFGWRQALPVALLSDAAVQKDLGLSTESIQKLKDGTSDINWSEVLTPEQKVRLEQIHLQQARLINAFSDTAVIKELGGFTDRQQQSIQAAHKHWHAIRESFPNKLRNGRVRYQPDEFQKRVAERMQQNEQELTKNLLNVLTPEQAKKFHELKGKPLERPMSDRRSEK